MSSSSDEDFPDDYVMYCSREDWADVSKLYEFPDSFLIH